MGNSFEQKSNYDIKFISVKRTFKSLEFWLLFNDNKKIFEYVFILLIELQKDAKGRTKANLTLDRMQLHLNQKTKQ